MNVFDKVRATAKDLRAGRGNAAESWALASRLLERLTNDGARIQQVIQGRDLDGLDALINAIDGVVTAAAEAPVQEFPANDLDAAHRAFHKRIKVSRLADESRLGGRYTSGGRHSNIDAIQPPDGFPDAIWQALVRSGKLKDMGGGFFSEA
ncbi:MAG: hypothetical protein ACREJD_05540 [Phycisphaerales bacterium]